ncbi:hypothetical protein [Alistipes shahii]|uniref:hypothetical protein n=1 Tax=Alistipes shahii TaxID=328814 RepID=UPI00267528B6|nr:hypothetical protein [Alistipes shahii]
MRNFRRFSFWANSTTEKSHLVLNSVAFGFADYIWKKLDNEDPDAAYKNFSYPTERMIGFNLTLKL